MKRCASSLGLLLICAFSLFAEDAKTPFDYLQDSLVNVLYESSLLELADYKYQAGFSVWGAYIEASNKVTLANRYEAGTSYLLLAAASDTKTDIDLVVYEGSGTSGAKIAEDSESDGQPMVTFTPKTSGLYTFAMKNVSNSNSFCSLVILEKTTTRSTFSLEELSQALDTILLFSKVGALASTDVPVNKFCLYGGEIEDGSTQSLFNVKLPAADYIVLGAASDKVNDMALDVLEQKAAGASEGNSVATKQDKVQSFDVIMFTSDPSKYYCFDVENQDSSASTAFLFAFILQL